MSVSVFACTCLNVCVFLFLACLYMCVFLRACVSECEPACTLESLNSGSCVHHSRACCQDKPRSLVEATFLNTDDKAQTTTYRALKCSQLKNTTRRPGPASRFVVFFSSSHPTNMQQSRSSHVKDECSPHTCTSKRGMHVLTHQRCSTGAQANTVCVYKQERYVCVHARTLCVYVQATMLCVCVCVCTSNNPTMLCVCVCTSNHAV